MANRPILMGIQSIRTPVFVITRTMRGRYRFDFCYGICRIRGNPTTRSCTGQKYSLQRAFFALLETPTGQIVPNDLTGRPVAAVVRWMRQSPDSVETIGGLRRFELA